MLFARPALLDRSRPFRTGDEVAPQRSSPILRPRCASRCSAGSAACRHSGRDGARRRCCSRRSPMTRRACAGSGLTLGTSKPGFWGRPDAQEHLKRLLVDPDAQVRVSRCDRRAVPADCRARAESRVRWRWRAGSSRSRPTLRSKRSRHSRDRRRRDRHSSSVTSDVALGRSRLLSLSTFRRKVNPLFYQAGEDQHAVRGLPRQPHDPPDRRGRRDAEVSPARQLMINYNSALKVVNLGEPEASLILRKPRSPQGTGGPIPSSPTGLTHVGGPQVGKPEHPAYRAILDWIREASIGRSGQADETELSRPTAMPRVMNRPRPATATCPRSGIPSSSVRRRVPPRLVVDLGSARTSRACSTSPARTLQRPCQRLRDPRLARRQDLGRASRLADLGQRPDLQVCRPSRPDARAMSSFAA